MRLLFVALLLVAVLALSGCGDKPSDNAVNSSEEENATPLGSGIRGVVVTTTIQPIQGATVRVVETGDSTESDVFGRFQFDLEPGTYRLEASAENHDSAEQTVTVQPDKPARPRIQLESLKAALPFHQTIQFDGSISASLGPADDASAPAKNAAGADQCTCTFQIPISKLTVAVTVEALWEDSFSPGEAMPTQYRYNVTSGTGTYFASGAGASPLRAHLPASAFTEGFDFAEHATLDVTLLPDAIWPTLDQSYTLFVTVWDVLDAPEGWAYLRGDR